MIKNVYVIDSENWYWWMDTKREAKEFIEKIKKEDNQSDIRFTYSKCHINEDNNDIFEELEILEIY